MAGKGKRLFSAERDMLAQRNKDATLGDVMAAIRSLEESVKNNVFHPMVIAEETPNAAEEEETKTPIDEIMAEIHNLNDHISATKQEIAALKTDDDSDTPIASATEELAEVVKSTEKAANAILENA